jgi:hypothetical protein
MLILLSRIILTAKVNISWTYFVQGLMVPTVIVIIHKCNDLPFQLLLTIVMFQANDVLHRPILLFDCSPQIEQG